MKNLVIIIGTIVLGTIIVSTLVLGSDGSLEGASKALVGSGITKIGALFK